MCVIWVPVYMFASMCGGTRTYSLTCGQRSKAAVKSSSIILFILTQLLSLEPGLSNIASQASPPASEHLSSSTFKVTELQETPYPPGISVGCGALNSNPHACKVITLSMVPSLSPVFVVYMSILYPSRILSQ